MALVATAFFNAGLFIGIHFFGVEEDITDMETYKPDRMLNTAVIEWVSDPLDVGAELLKINIERGYIDEVGYVGGGRIGGLAEYQDGDRHCRIFAYEPAGAWDTKYMEILGHEALHCFRGNFHE